MKWLPALVVLTTLSPAQATECLVPDKPSGRIYNYFCTWAAQGYIYGQGAEHLDWKTLLKADATTGMSEAHLTNKTDGWLQFYPKVRTDLWFLLDDGYYEITTTPEEGMATMVFDTTKFPSCGGQSPADRLKTIANLVRQSGWHGILRKFIVHDN